MHASISEASRLPAAPSRPAPPPSPQRRIFADQAGFRRDYDRIAFRVRHALADHPLFALPRLAQLAEKLRERGDKDRLVAHRARANRTGSKFTEMGRLEVLPDAFSHLTESGAWMKLSQANLIDPDYRALLDDLLEELEALSGRKLRDEITWPILTIFLSSPGIVTPYHIDHESNFLLQVQGEKDVCLYDPADRAVLPIEEIERFYSGNAEAASYRDELAPRGTVYRLKPGDGVHHPPLAPHWVRNGDAVSVSVSISFCTRTLDRMARVHQANLILRRLGLHPSPPGARPLGDSVKAAALHAVSKRRPETRNEMLFSGVRRLARPIAAARRVSRLVGA